MQWLICVVLLLLLLLLLCVQSVVLQRFDLQLQPGDIIVTGSDGLWDNIFAEEAATIASKCRDKGETATTAAQVLCRWVKGAGQLQ
jgi:serine/threonine protein phosphatase PrpC